MVVLCSVRLSAICLYAVWALSAPVPAQGMGRHLLAAKKAERIHIFVGGSHFSGANTIEKILSSQYMASGFRTEWTTVKSTGMP